MDPTQSPSMDPQTVKTFFFWVQFALALIFGGLFWGLRRHRFPDSGFKDSGEPVSVREEPPSHSSIEGTSSKASSQPPPGPMRLTGIRIDGSPHEILGILPEASPEEIQAAYRTLMKRYHPDRVGRPGSREWKDAQQIAEAINRAKEMLLKK